MFFKQLFDAESSTYTYLIADDTTHEAVIIDPVFAQVERDMQLVRNHALKLKYTLETHVHADHITAAQALKKSTGAATAVAADCHAEGYDRSLKNGDIILFGHEEITVIATPGHTPGSVSFLWRDRVFTGDALLIGGCGRTDFQGGSAEALWRSITETLFSLDEQTLVYPGHDYKGRRLSSIAEEKRFNARVSGKSREEFIAIMNNLGLAAPKHMHEAVPANLGAGARQAENYVEHRIATETIVQSASATQLSEAMAAGKVNILDIRTAGEFDTFKLAGSINIPMDKLKADDVISRFGADATLYCICQTGTRSQLAATKLRTAGMQHVIHVDGGTNAWISAGFPVESGARNVMSLERQTRISAGTLIVIGLAIGTLWHPAGYWIAAVIGTGLIYAGLSNSCGMSSLLARMPWNK